MRARNKFLPLLRTMSVKPSVGKVGIFFKQRRLFQSSIMKDITLQNGDNALHQAALDIKSDDKLIDHMVNYTFSELSDLSRQTNNWGDTPVDIIHRRFNKKDEKIHRPIFYFLISLMTEINLKKLNDPVIDEVSGNLSGQLKLNLQTAYQIINATRSVVKESTTHPDFNAMPLMQQLLLRQNLARVRAKALSLLLTSPNRYVYHCAKSAMMGQTGNCEEFSYVSLYHLNEMNVHIKGEVYRIMNGDHCFLVLGRDQNSHPIKWETWNPDAVVCDAWVGDAFSVSQIPERLLTYKGYIVEDRRFSTLPTFNPNFHMLDPVINDLESGYNVITNQTLFGKTKRRVDDVLFVPPEHRKSFDSR